MTAVIVQRRSGLRHGVAPDGLATRCGRIMHRKNWKPLPGARRIDCIMCLSLLASDGDLSAKFAITREWTKAIERNRIAA